MKRIFSIFLILFSLCYINAQTYNFAWLTDTHIGSPGADSDLSAIVEDINNRTNLSFIVVTGDIAEKGKNDELEKAAEILGQLKMPYYIIGGNHDTKWSESGGTKFIELWNAGHFIFNYDGHWHIGLTSGIIWRGGGGHASPEDIEWLKDTLKNINPEKLFLYMHHPPDGDTDNWFKIINAVRQYNPVLVLVGHGHSNRSLNFSGIPGVMSRSTLKAKGNPGYTWVQVNADSVLFSEIDISGKIEKWNSSPLNVSTPSFIDSVQYINYGMSDAVKKELNVTVSAPLLEADGRIFVSTYSSGIVCFDYQGKELWRYNPHGTILSRPVFYDGILVSSTAEGDLFTLEAHTGKLIQVIGLGEPVTSQLQTIDVEYNDEVTRGIIAGTGNGNLYCYDLYSFEMIWSNNSATGMIETLPLYIDGKLIYGAWDGFLYCINSSSGVLNWKWADSKNFYYSPAACTPVTDGKLVYISAPDKYITAIDLLLGTTVWKKNNYAAWETLALSSDKQQLYVKGIDGDFFIVSAKDGKQLHKLEIKYDLDTTPSPPVETGQYIFFGSKNGWIYSINKADYSWKKLIFMGTARIHSLILLENNKISALNMDGTLVISGTGQ